MSEPTKCKASVWQRDRSFRGGRSVQCTRAAKVEGFCTQHHPDTIKARDLKSRQEYEAKWEAERARRAVELAAPDLLAALAGIIEIGKRDLTNPKYDAYFEEARAALKKAGGAL